MPATFIRHLGACVCGCYGQTLFSSWVLSTGFYEVFPVSRTILKKGVSVLGSSFKKSFRSWKQFFHKALFDPW